MKKLVHNLTASSQYLEEQKQYAHVLSVVVSDTQDDGQVIRSEQFNMSIMPVMEPDQFLLGLRALADTVENYIKEEPDEV